MDITLLSNMASILVEHAKLEKTIYYGDLSRRIGGVITPQNLNKPLGILSDAAKRNGYPLISSVVVNKDTLIPGEGFFKEFGGEIKMSEWLPFWQKELAAVYNCKKWDEFLRTL